MDLGVWEGHTLLPSLQELALVPSLQKDEVPVVPSFTHEDVELPLLPGVEGVSME